MSKAPTPHGHTDGGWQGPRVLVIGCGFIGSHIVKGLVEDGRSPVVLTRSRPGEDVVALLEKANLHIGDARDPKVLEAALEGVGAVVYSAGGLLPAASEEDPELDAKLTLEPVRAVLEALRSRPGVGLTYLSSGGTVYGEPERVPVDEDAPTEAFGAYGRLHLACEAEVIRESEATGLNARILRCATVYGEYQLPDRGQGAVVTFLHRIEKGTPVQIFGDGSTVRDYVYAGDVAKVVNELVGRDDGPAVLNVGAGEGTALIDLLRMAEAEVGRAAEIERLPERDFEVRQVVLDTTRLRELVAYEPTPLAEGVSRTHRWLAETRERV